MCRAWIALLAILIFGLAGSYRPVPGPSKTSHEPQTQSENEDTAASNLRLFSDQRPRNQQSSADKDAPGWWVVWGIIFNGGLLVVAFLQWRTYTRQEDILQSQLRLEQAQFHATHRPKLIARAIYITAASVDRRIRLYFHLYNSGDVAATVESFKFFAKVQGSELVEFLRFTLDSENPPFVIDVGEEKRWETHADDSRLLFQYMDASNIQIWAPAGSDISFEFRGDIAFLDGAQKRRHCSFHRTYNFQTKCFVRLENSEFEYSD